MYNLPTRWCTSMMGSLCSTGLDAKFPNRWTGERFRHPGHHDRRITPPFKVQTVESARELYLQYLHRSCCYMFSCTTAQHIYCTNILQSATELYIQNLNRSCCYMFNCTTAQHIYCTNTVQTVQAATELYLQ